ncbi:hypothetical protein [Elioraea sp.]|uniref:hypothetical protein n=1 Tax=Elioraea sp. TaxID=2185103 RepID=UPI0025BEF8E8|nr:hypothetical protein [Elioraea sp.]
MSVKRPIQIASLLEWTYRRQRADVVIDRGIGLHLQEREMMGVEPCARASDARVAAIAELGVRVDGGGMAATDCHPDAEVIHHVVSSLDDRQQGIRLSALLIQHAKAATRPPAEVLPRAVPQLNIRGKPLVVHEVNDKGRNYGHCPITWGPSLAYIAAVEAEHARWVSGLRLVTLALHLAARLTLWHPIPPEVDCA